MNKPYVISAELDLIPAGFENVIDPRAIDGFRQSLESDLGVMGKDVCWASSGDLSAGLRQKIDNTRLPVVSLDTRYIRSAAYFIGLSRAVDGNLEDAGYAPRAGFPVIERQLAAVAQREREVVIADDVLFSGEMLSWLRDGFAAKGVRVSGVICGVAVAEGTEKLEASGMSVDSVMSFGEVEDEICERDFAVVPGSGRRLIAGNKNALYFDTVYGRPAAWASIPQDRTSQFCWSSLERSRSLLRPDVPMRAVGSFVGYAASGKAVDMLAARMGTVTR